jgi:hypothetical protein
LRIHLSCRKAGRLPASYPPPACVGWSSPSNRLARHLAIERPDSRPKSQPPSPHVTLLVTTWIAPTLLCRLRRQTRMTSRIIIPFPPMIWNEDVPFLAPAQVAELHRALIERTKPTAHRQARRGGHASAATHQRKERLDAGRYRLDARPGP